uniref:Integrase catalytic domain-containing protein n=1 Tax=Nicotiana tabacum TaxID=4097 RepID=A0A1S4C9H0_TOBAC|nr:PREDICTED: uncharacterized protein LOC107816543 [Nicotiana tabacum]
MVAQCPNCQQVKVEHQRPGGLTQCIELPLWKWDMINMDFITGLPRTPWRYDSIWVIIDRLTKSAHFLLVRTTYSAEDYAKLFIREIVHLHGVPLSIISDRGAQFTVHFWKSFQKGLELGAVHPVFHVSMLRKCIGDPSRITPIDDICIAEDLSYAKVPVAILDRQPENLEDKQLSKEGPERQLEKGKIAVEINGVPMTYAKAILSPGKQGPQQQTSLAVMANLKPPGTCGQARYT